MTERLRLAEITSEMEAWPDNSQRANREKANKVGEKVMTSEYAAMEFVMEILNRVRLA